MDGYQRRHGAGVEPVAFRHVVVLLGEVVRAIAEERERDIRPVLEVEVAQARERALLGVGDAAYHPLEVVVLGLLEVDELRHAEL